jgi:hypothetical protein
MCGRKEEAMSARKWLPFYPSSKASRGQLTNRAATISDGGAGLTGSAVDAAAKLRH